MAQKHFIIYYKRGTGTFVVTEPRPWARENQGYFPTYDFITSHPTTAVIEAFLITSYGFIRSPIVTIDITVIYNLDPGLIL